MISCPKCSFHPVKGRYCGKCGYPINQPTKAISVDELATDISDSLETEQEQIQTISQETIEKLKKTIKSEPDNPNAYIELAKAQMQTGRLEQAFSTFRAAKTICPDDAEVYRCGATILEVLNRKDQAIKTYSKLLSLKPGDMEATLNYSQLLFDNGQKEKALESLENLLRSAGNNPELLIRIAQIHLSIGNASKAQDYLSQYRKVSGETQEMFLLMGETMLKREFYDGAIKNFREGISFFPNNSNLRLGLGKAYLGMGEKGKALLEFEQALNKDPNNTFILLEFGKLQGAMGMHDQADKTFEKIERIKAANGDCYLEMAKYFLNLGNHKRAQAYLEKANELSPYDYEIQKTLGITFEKQKEFEKAIETYTAVIELAPNTTWAHEGIIRSSDKAEKFELKSKSQKALLELQTSTAEDWCNYGETLIRLGDFQGAEQAFESASKLDPTNPRAYQAPELIKIEKARAEGEKLANQAKEALAKKFFLTASERLTKALELVPNEPNWNQLYAKVSLKTAEIAQSSKLLAKLRTANPEDFQTNYDLARVYEAENKIQLAIELLSSTIKDHPTELNAHLMLLRLKRSQIRGTRLEKEMHDALIKNLQLDLAHLRKDSPIPLMVEAYANYIFGFRAKFQKEAFAQAERLFKEAQEKFGNITELVNGLCLLARAQGNIHEAAKYAKEVIKSSSDPHQLYALARLNENFQHYTEAQKCYGSLKNLFPENGIYRRKFIEMTAKISEAGSKNELMNFLSDHHNSLQNKPDQIWLLYETAIAQELMAHSSPQKDEWTKKALLNWHKAVNHPQSNHWIRWGMTNCQIKNLKGPDLRRAINNNLKECEKVLREMPDTARAYYEVANCHLAYGDLTQTDAAFKYLEKAYFLNPNDAEISFGFAKTSKTLGKSVLVDGVGYNMILLEPELALSIFQI